MYDEIKEAIANLISVTRDISIEEARDIVKETQYTVNDTLTGDTIYNSPDEVIEDYLGLCADYTFAFIDDIDNASLFTEIESAYQYYIDDLFELPDEGELDQ